MHKLVSTIFSLVCLACAVAIAAPRVPKTLPDPAAQGIAGGALHPLTEARMAKKRGVVFFFVTTDCPIANRFAPEINRICKDYEKQGMAFYIVQTDPKLDATRARKHAKEYQLACPILLDRKHEIVKFAGASVTPEAALASPDGKVLYLGRIDDRYAAIGQFRVEPRKRDLRLALDEVLQGKPIATARTKAIGCYIEG
jgi:peroxiredoxin